MTATPEKMPSPDGRPEKPYCAFRVGVTGARQISPEALPTVRRQIESVLTAVANVARATSSDETARKVYRLEGDGSLKPRLRALSPLADGADRLFAELARKLGYTLDVALPFERNEYANDFSPDSRADFERWIGSLGGACLEIDGGRDEEKWRTDYANRSYEAVGRLVVRNCDLLIAVWDGGPSKGRGGTAEIVRSAAHVGPPVWWIDASGIEPPRLIRTIADLRWHNRALRDVAAGDLLDAIIIRDLIPPFVGAPTRRGLIGRVAHGFGVRRRAPSDPMRTYLQEEKRPRRRCWQTHRWFFRIVAGPPASHSDDPEDTGSFWERQYRHADAASLEYRDRYRSSYVLLFMLATLAVVCAVFSLGFACLEPYLGPLELAWFLAIAALVALNQRRDWQGRWIAYRLLAELCRKQEALALLGWSLPAPDLRLMGNAGAPTPWVGWYFNTLLRTAPLASGRLRDELPKIRDLICAKLISGQEHYHRDRKHLSERAAQRLSLGGEVAFLATCAIVIVKVLLVEGETVFHAERLHGWGVDLGVAAAILPAVSAALFGIRAYAELELLEQQSARLEQTMRDAGRRIRELPLDRILSSQDLAAEIFDLSTAMLQDISGWAALFQLKAVEVG